MLVFLALVNAKVLSFALGDAKVPNTNDFASQWNIGFSYFFQRYFSTFDKIKTKMYIKNLRHFTLHMSLIYRYSRCPASNLLSEISQFKKCKLKSNVHQSSLSLRHFPHFILYHIL